MIKVIDTDGKEWNLDLSKMIEIDYFMKQTNDGNEYYIEYFPLKSYDSEYIKITREEFLKHV